MPNVLLTREQFEARMEAMASKHYTIDDREPRTLTEYALCLDMAEDEVRELRKRLSEAYSCLEWFMQGDRSISAEEALRRYREHNAYAGLNQENTK